MKSKKCLLAILILNLLSAIVLIPVKTEAKITFIDINKTKVVLEPGKSTKLKITKNGKKSAAVWTSSNKKVATVGKKTGKVKAIKKGTATITGKVKTSFGKKRFLCKVTVKDASGNNSNGSSGDNNGSSGNSDVNSKTYNENEWYDEESKEKEDGVLVKAIPCSSASYVQEGAEIGEAAPSFFLIRRSGNKKFIVLCFNSDEGRLRYTPSMDDIDLNSSEWQEKLSHPYMYVYEDDDYNIIYVGVDTSDGKPDTNNNYNDADEWQDDEWYDVDIKEDYKVIYSLPASSDSYFSSDFSGYTPDHVDFCYDNIDGKNVVFVYAKNPEGNIERLYYETVGFEGEDDYNIWMEKFTHPYMKVMPGKDGTLDMQGVDYK